MKLHFLGAHNTESKQAKMVSLVVDDVIAVDAGGLTSSLSFRSQTKLKSVLLTHQHYDHIRDLPALAMNLYARGASVEVVSTLPVLDALRTYLFDGSLYPNFFDPRDGRTVLRFRQIDPHQTLSIGDYTVRAEPVVHPVPTVGFHITGPQGEAAFYSGDTGPGLFETWRHISPQVVVIEVTLSDRHIERARQTGHLTPNLLGAELATFRQMKGYLPKVVAVHMDPTLEATIETEISTVASDLPADISLAHEGMVLDIPAP